MVHCSGAYRLSDGIANYVGTTKTGKASAQKWAHTELSVCIMYALGLKPLFFIHINV